MLFLLVRSARVQTAVAGVFTDELSRALQAEVHVDRLDYRFFNNLDISGFYVGDQSGDTLLFLPSLTVRFNPFAIDDNRLDFRHIRLLEPYLSIAQDSLGTNFDFLLRAFASSDSVHRPFTMRLNVDDIVVDKARIRYRHFPSGTDLFLSDIDARLQLPLYTQDTLSARLVALSLNAHVGGVDARLAGTFHGSLDSLFADDLVLDYRGQQLLLGDAAVYNPLNLDSLYTQVHCRDLYANGPLVQDFLSDILRRPITLPDRLRHLGDVHYRGDLSGHLSKLVLHGAFLTRLGTVSTQAIVCTDSHLSSLVFDGTVTTSRFRLGRLLNNPDFGRVSASASVRVHYTAGQPLYASGRVAGSLFEYKGYAYQGIALDGTWNDSIFDGSVRIDDPNLGFDAGGSVNFSHQDPFADLAFRLDRLRLRELHLADKAEGQDLRFRGNLSLFTDGTEPQIVDRLHGVITIDSLFAVNAGHTLFMKQFRLSVENDNVRRLLVQSDFVNAGVTGPFRWSSFRNTFRRFAVQFFPSFLPYDGKNGAQQPNDLSFYVYLMHADTLLHVLGNTDISMPKLQTLQGYVHESSNDYALQLYIPSVLSGNSAYKDITLSLNNVDRQGNLALSLLSHTIDPDSTQLRIGDIGVFLATTARSDSLLTTLRLGSGMNFSNAAPIEVHTHLSRYNSRPFVSAHILPADFVLADTLWTLHDSRIEYNAADTTLAVHGFNLEAGNNFLRINGLGSTRPDDSIRFDLGNIDIAPLLSYLTLANSVSIEGYISGWATLYALFSAPVFEANVRLPEVQLNYTSLGALDAVATLDRSTGHILITGDAVQNGHTIAHVDGNVVPDEAYWELFIKADSADLAFINFWTEGIIEDIVGRGYGDVHVFGKGVDTWVTAKACAKDAALTIPYTGGRYFFSDSVIMDTTEVRFPSIRLRDREGHTGTAAGVLTHDRFMDLKYNIALTCNNLLAMDLPYDPQSMYYGTAYATGRVDIAGDERQVKINVNARTEANTDFYLSVATASEAADNRFITFTDHTAPQRLADGETNHREKDNVPPQTQDAAETALLLSLAIEATPDAKIHLAIDPHNGDGIVGRGEGDIRFTMNNSDIRLVGTYALQSGIFSYTLGNIVHRDFIIAEGSKVVWNGKPEEPILDVTARYRVTASLKDLFGSDAANLATNRSSVPVDCVIRLSDRLFNPVLRFGIELPQSDETINSQVKSIINTDDMMMRQVVYLLVFNRFFTPEHLRKSSATGLNETYSLLSSTVTGQINSWLGKLTDVFAMGFNFRTDGEGADASQEYEAQFRINPVNRLTINGNFGYRYNDLSNRPFFGDVDIEYQLTRDGKLRAKAFTHTVDKYSLRQANTVQGVGLLFRHDFNWGDARRKRAAKKAQNKEPE